MERSSLIYLPWTSNHYYGNLNHVVTWPKVPVLGSYQYIDKLNYGRFVPGIYRANSVVISKTQLDATLGYVKSKSWFDPGEAWYELDGYMAATNVSVSSAGPSISGRPALAAWDTNLASRTLVNSWAKLNEVADFELGVMFGELAETLELLLHPFRGVLKLLSKKHFRSPRRVARAGADAWMEFRYGIRPFANDICSLALLFNRLAMQMDTAIHTRRSHAEKSYSYFSSWSRGEGDFTSTYVVRGTVRESYTSGVSYFLRPKPYDNMYHRFGVAWHDMPNVAWELVPLSFVVDWFWSVGPWLRAIMPNPNVSVCGSYTSRKIEETGTVTNVRCVLPVRANWTRGPHGSNLSYTFTKLERRLNSALPALPVRRFEWLGFAKLLDSVILAWQRLPLSWIIPRRR